MFADLPRLDPDIVSTVMGEPSVAAGGPVAITPMTLASAGRQLPNLAAMRLDRAHGGTASEATVDLDEVRDWACEDLDLSPAVAGRLAKFLVLAAKACSGVVPGFAVECLGDGLLLHEDDVVHGWEIPPDGGGPADTPTP